jgi:hypothetical protein
MRDIAKRLIELEAPQAPPDGTDIPAAFLVCEKLRPHLAPLMGAGGFHALLSRALTRAQAEVPRLSTVQVNADGALARLEDPGIPLKSEEVAEGGREIVAQLLSLLNAFVGEGLTLRMLRTAWPKFPRRS